MSSPVTGLGAVLMTMATLASGCGSNNDESVVTIYAASSLTDVMDQVEVRFEEDHPGVDVRVNLAGTNTLIRQLNSGAEADVIVAADVTALDQLIESPTGQPVALATNSLALIVPVDNPAGIEGVDELADADVLTARCATGVPCGNATDRYLTETGVVIGRSTDEANVRSVLAKVTSGEVDAGFVYRSDLTAADNVTDIPLDDPPEVTVAAARLTGHGHAVEMLALLESDDIAGHLVDLGFEPVEPVKSADPAVGEQDGR